jgi:hypothetical protein
MLIENLNVLQEIANQAYNLAMGLQNAAPPGAAVQSAQYLIETALQLRNIYNEIDQILPVSLTEQVEQEIKLAHLLKLAVDQDKALREKFGINNKFRFISERLQAALAPLEQHLKSQEGTVSSEMTKKKGLLDDEMIVYVYLYNIKGALLSNWQGMLSEKVFYEYSINRPIYMEKSHIEALLKSKSNKTQHAYLMVAVKSTNVIQTEAAVKDSLGNPIVKVREGALRFNKLMAFTYNEQDYVLSEQGALVKK